MQRQDLERMSREQLIAEAERLGIPRPRVLTGPELIDEIIGRTSKNERERQRARGWLGRARDLLAQVVEKGLHLPEAARVLRQEDKSWPAPPPPLPTVTLAEIYAAQGHFERAVAVLDEVLAREPEHREARALRERFVEQAQRSRSRSGRIETPPPPAVREAAPSEEAGTAREEEVAATPVEAAPVEEEAVAPSNRMAASANALEAAPAQAQAASEEAAAASEEPAGLTEEMAALADEAEGLIEEAASSTDAVALAPPELDAVALLDEPELPQRYEVDEVVAIAVDPRTIYLYWEVRATTLAAARARQPDGALTVRIASVTASWDGPVVDARDLHVDALYGDRFVRDVQPGSNVRVSIGWKGAAGFEPVAVGAEVTAPRAVAIEAVAEEKARWEEVPAGPFAVAPFSAWRPEERAIEARSPSAAPQPARVELPWSRARASEHAGVVAAPVDTGVAVWTEVTERAPAGAEAREEVTERIEQVTDPWFIAGGSSELSRGGPGQVRTVRTVKLVPGPPRWGGASELSRG